MYFLARKFSLSKAAIRSMLVAVPLLAGMAVAHANNVVAFDNTANGNSSDVVMSGSGTTMVGGTGGSNHYYAGQLFDLTASGDLSSVSIWASNSSSPMTYSLSVFTTSAQGQLGTLLETLTGTTPANPGNGPPHFDFINLTSSTDAYVQANTPYWFVVTTVPPAGYWGAESGTTPVNNDSLNYLYTTGTSLTPGNVTYSNIQSGILQESALVTVTSVPEPETCALMLAGLGLIGFMARRKSKSQAS